MHDEVEGLAASVLAGQQHARGLEGVVSGSKHAAQVGALLSSLTGDDVVDALGALSHDLSVDELLEDLNASGSVLLVLKVLEGKNQSARP